MAKQNRTVVELPADADGEHTDEGNTTAMQLVGDEVSLAEIVASFGGGSQSSDWDVVVDSGDGVYWPTIPGAALHGTVESRYSIETKFGTAWLYNLRLIHAADAITSDGEAIKRQPGESIIVLERTVLKDLANCVGREVIISCDGQKATKKGNKLWTYRVLKKRLPPEAEQALAMSRMANHQTAQLER